MKTVKSEGYGEFKVYKTESSAMAALTRAFGFKHKNDQVSPLPNGQGWIQYPRSCVKHLKLVEIK